MGITFPSHTPDPLLASIGLRSDHYRAFADARPAVGFLEVHSENYFGDGGQPLDWLMRFRRDHAVSLHGVGMSLGSADGLDARHLDKLARLVERIEPALVSDHLCWASVGGVYANDLLPLPCTREALDHIARRIEQVQEALGRAILVENVSSYLQYRGSEMQEWEFLAELSRRSGCGILLDVNNIHVSASNHGLFDQRAIHVRQFASKISRTCAQSTRSSGRTAAARAVISPKRAPRARCCPPPPSRRCPAAASLRRAPSFRGSPRSPAAPA